MSAKLLPRFLRHEATVVGLLAALIALASGGWRASPYNNYVLLAQAFLQGHTWIEWPGPYIDALAYNGAHYIIEAPLPGLLLMPFVAIFGPATNQSLLGVGLLAIAVAAGWTLLERIGAIFETRCWLTLFLFAGTDLWWCASLGDVWLIAHVASVAMTLLALCELAGPRRPWVVAAWGCAATASRFSLLLALPVYALLLLEPVSFAVIQVRTSSAQAHYTWMNIRQKLEPFALVVALGITAWLAYNEARWQLPYDIGYSAWYHLDQMGDPHGSPFQWRYIPYQCQSFFLSLPEKLAQYPWLDAPIVGQSLSFTSPALVIAFMARGNNRGIALLWLATFAVALPSFMYYVNGFAQFGMRHALDFEPFLFVLMGLAMRKGSAWWAKILCGYSALVGTWGVWYWHTIRGH